MDDLIPIENPLSFKKALFKSPVNKKYRHQLRMAIMPREKLDIYRLCYITRNQKLGYYKNSKAACTTILGLLSYYASQKKVTDPHKSPPGLLEGRFYLHAADIAFMKPSPTYTFSSVRHPETRVLSAYKNFFIDKTNRAGPKHFDSITKRGFTLGEHSTENLDIFIDYIDEAISQNRRHCDGHWREQHVNLGLNTISYDKICKLENLEQDLVEVFSAVGASDFTATIAASKKQNSSSKMEVLLSKQQRAKVERIFAQDYEVFGY